MKKRVYRLPALLLAALLLAACGANKPFSPSNEVVVVSREDGSGTRGAFVELFGIEGQGPGGQTIDLTTLEANVTNSTAVVMNTVAGNPYAVGYLSLGSLNAAVKPLCIDGVEPTADNIRSGSYTVARPFILATGGQLSQAATQFMAYVLSAEGQAVVAENGYIPLPEAPPFGGVSLAGRVVVAGSSSVTPVMEKIKEAYNLVNPLAEVEIQQSDSTTGITGVLEGICDIGMVSRQLKDSEAAQGIVPTVIAQDGIVVVANHQNPVSNLTIEEVRALFMGDLLHWDELPPGADAPCKQSQ